MSKIFLERLKKRTRGRELHLAGSVLALSGAMVFLPGGLCGHSCQDHFFVEPADVLTGAMAWVRNGTPGQADIENSDAPDAPCVAEVDMWDQGGTDYESDVETVLAITCFNPYRVTGALAEEWMYLLLRMSDLRQWAEGPVPPQDLPSPDPSEDLVELDSQETCTDPYDIESCADLCRAYPDSQVQVEVLTAEGGPADYPEVVTPDFLRVIRFEVDTGTPVAGRTDEGFTCADTRSATVLLTVTLDASHFYLGEMCF